MNTNLAAAKTTQSSLTLADIEAADRRLEGVVRRTPLVEDTRLNEIAGGRVLIKPECLQLTGSFKYRGASNKIRKQAPSAVVAYSSGNHAQGVALAASNAGIPAWILMPGDAPQIKIDNCRGFGAEVIFFDRFTADRDALAEELAARHSALIIKPFDDYDVMAGQGTVGLEMVRSMQAMNLAPDQAVTCCGGGGLTAGVATALKAHFPRISLFTSEPALFDDTARSLAAGERLSNPPNQTSICDSLLSFIPGALTFPINKQLLTGGVAVSEAEVCDAMRFAMRNLKLVVEPGGAVALAAVLSGKIATQDKTTLVIISGGNVDPELFASTLGPAGMGQRG